MSKMFEEEPEPLDENDVGVKEELFDSMKAMGAKPQDLSDPNDSAEYEAWLDKNQTT